MLCLKHLEQVEANWCIKKNVEKLLLPYNRTTVTVDIIVNMYVHRLECHWIGDYRQDLV